MAHNVSLHKVSMLPVALPLAYIHNFIHIAILYVCSYSYVRAAIIVVVFFNCGQTERYLFLDSTTSKRLLSRTATGVVIYVDICHNV